jgi:hypothetical protein
MERFVPLITGGGVLLVVGLWMSAAAGTGSVPWLLGVALALGGAGGLVAGIGSEIDLPTA